MRWCSLLNLWFSSSSLRLSRSKASPFWRPWTSSCLTASTGSGTAVSSTEPSLNLEAKTQQRVSELTCQHEDLWAVKKEMFVMTFFFLLCIGENVRTAFRNTLETVGDTMKTTKYSFLFWKKKQEVQLRLHSNTASVLSWQMTMTNYDKHVSLVFIDNTHTHKRPLENSVWP